MKLFRFLNSLVMLALLLASGEAFGGYYIQVCGVTDRAKNYIGSGSTLSQAKKKAKRQCVAESVAPGRCSAAICRRVFQATKVSDLSKQEQSRLKERARMAPGGQTPKAPKPDPVYRRCAYDYQCPGSGNSCHGGSCSKAGFSCDQESDCPGPRNGCVAGTCRREESVCNSESDCLGSRNRCVGGTCVIP